MNAPNEISQINLLIAQILQEWGWLNAPDEVLDQATKAAQIRGVKTGQVLVDWEIIDEETRDRLLGSKPPKVPTLDHFAEQDSNVLPYKEQIRALHSGYPFYEKLSVLQPHDMMEDASVFKRCESLDAVLMTVEQERAVLVFHEFEALSVYVTNGKSVMATDPIVAANDGKVPLLAVALREETTSLLKRYSRVHSSASQDDENSNALNIWHVRTNDPKRSPEQRELARIFDHAITEGASDVAFVPMENGSLEVYIRKFGLLIPAFKEQKEGRAAHKSVINSAIAGPALNFIQAKSNVNKKPGRLRLPGDGNLRYKSAAGDAYMRISVIPLFLFNDLKHLRSVSVRIFERKDFSDGSSIDLAQLRVPEHVLEHLRDAMTMAAGVILASGPLNQGKSTLIAGMLAEHVRIHGDTKKRISLEEPIERNIPGVTQFQAPDHIEDPGERFSVMLKGFKRHDFNVMFLGEIRDSDGADYSVRFASSGHLFLTTIHARDALMAFDILYEMVDPDLRFQLIESMSLSSSQRLIPEVCKCGTKHSPITPDERRLFQKNLTALGADFPVPETFTRTNPDGCDKCMFGAKGSLPVIELLPFTREVKDAAHLLRRGDNVAARKVIQDAKLTTLLGEGLKYVNAGLADLNAILFL